MMMEHDHAARQVQVSEGVKAPVQGRQGTCRICLEDGGDLIAPCGCRGTSKWIHRECLNRWRVSRTNPRALTNCCECDSTYVLDLQRKISDEGEARRRRFARRIAAQGIFSFILVQLLPIVLGLIIRAVDVHQELVPLFNFPQTDHEGDGQDFYHALLHHKLTYYVAGLISFLALLGVFGVVVGLVSLCTKKRQGLPRSTPRSTCDCDAWDMYVCADCCHSCNHSCARCSLSGADGCRGCDCHHTGGGNNDLPVIILVIVIVFVIIGVFVGLVLIVMAMQRAAQEYAKLQQMRILSQEYIVRDLADETDLGEQTDAGGVAGTTQQEMESGIDPMQAFMVPDPEFQQRMQQMISKDIRAIYEGPDPRQALRDEPATSSAAPASVPLTGATP